jgi:hypothetical protein
MGMAAGLASRLTARPASAIYRSVDAALAVCRLIATQMGAFPVCLYKSGGGDHASFSAFVVFRPRVIRPCLL